MKALKSTITCIWIVLSSSVIFAQYPGINTIYIQNAQISDQQESDSNEFPKASILLSNDFIFSISATYEGIFTIDDNFYVALRGGPAYTAESGNDLALIGQASILAGESKHFFETGVGYYHNITYPDAFIVPIVGYRYMGKRGFSFKLYGDLLMDIIDDEEWGFLNAGIHISIGYRIRL